MTEHTDELEKRTKKIREQMGGKSRLEKMESEGKPNIRQHIDAILDEGTFQEIGTFSRSLREEDRETTPGDGKIGGEGEIDGRPVAIAGDDITVKRGSSSIVGSRKTSRLYERALNMGFPYVYFGETGGGRIPDLIGAEGISDAMPFTTAEKLLAQYMLLASSVSGERRCRSNDWPQTRYEQKAIREERTPAFLEYQRCEASIPIV